MHVGGGTDRRKERGSCGGSIPWKLQNPRVPRVPADGKMMDEANILSLLIFAQLFHLGELDRHEIKAR